MIEAVKEIGEYSLEKAGRRLEDPTDIVIENPDSNGTFKHILGIRINKNENGFEYAGIELEEYPRPPGAIHADRRRKEHTEKRYDQ